MGVCGRPQDHLPWWESVDNASNGKSKYGNIRMPFIYVEIRPKDPVQRVENICLQGRKWRKRRKLLIIFCTSLEASSIKH